MNGSHFGPVHASGYLDLTDARFQRKINVDVSASYVNLSRCSFQQGGALTIRRAILSLSGAVLGSAVQIQGSENASLRDLDNTDVGSLSLTNIDLRRCEFFGAHGLSSMSIDSTVVFRRPPKWLRAKRRCIIEEATWRSKAKRSLLGNWILEEDDLLNDYFSARERQRLNPAQISSVYRALRQSLQSRGDHSGAADFYYGEMEMRRFDGSTPLAERLIVWVYWLISGYGLRASRAFVSLGLLLCLGALAMNAVGLDTGDAGFPDAALATVTSAVPGIGPTQPLTLIGSWIELVLTITGPLLLGLGILAVRGRVQR